MSKEVFEVAAQYGGKDGFKAILPYFKRLKSVMKRHESKKYCKEIDQFSFLLRVDGDVRTFGFEGAQCLDLNLKCKYVSIDIGVPSNVWKDKSATDISQYLRLVLMQGIDEMITCLQKKGFNVDEKKLLNDFGSSLVEL